MNTTEEEADAAEQSNCPNCLNCMGVGDFNCTCSCKCHDMEVAKRHFQMLCAGCGYPFYQHWSHEFTGELHCPDPDVVGPPEQPKRK